MIGTRTSDLPSEPTAADLRLGARDAAVLARLVDRSSPVSVAGLAADLVEDADEPVDVDRAQVRLHHVALPKLDDAGLVDYDADERVVATTGEADLVTRLG